jgi:hypothetical protein
MSLPDWPAECPQAPSYPDGWAPVELSRPPDETEANTGDFNRRHNTVKRITRMRVAWMCSVEQWSALWTFWDVTLARGVSRFNMEVFLIQTGFTTKGTCVCMFRVDPIPAPAGPDRIRVTAELDVEFG